jgi:hypothetical protein
MSNAKHSRASRTSKVSAKPGAPKAPAQVSRVLLGTRPPDCLRITGEELLEEASRDRVLLGGCSIVEDSPSLACLNCGHRWN